MSDRQRASFERFKEEEEARRRASLGRTRRRVREWRRRGGAAGATLRVRSRRPRGGHGYVASVYTGVTVETHNRVRGRAARSSRRCAARGR